MHEPATFWLYSKRLRNQTYRKALKILVQYEDLCIALVGTLQSSRHYLQCQHYAGISRRWPETTRKMPFHCCFSATEWFYKNRYIFLQVNKRSFHWCIAIGTLGIVLLYLYCVHYDYYTIRLLF